MSDRIRVTGLALYGHHGVLAREREFGQRFVMDIEAETDLAPAATSDKVADTVHYGEMADVARDAFSEVRCDLIETVAQRVAFRVLARFEAIEAVTVTLHKPAAPVQAVFKDIAVSLRRTRADLAAT